jgi:hypothetical protein
MADNDDDDTHALAPFLSQRLPALGLDYETYGPYVLPLLQDSVADHDEDEWTSVMELLQASSESHSDDDQAWTKLRVDIETAWQHHCADLRTHEREELHQHAQEMQDKLQHDRELAAQTAIDLEQEKKVKKTVPAEMDEAKRALIAMYAFEDDGEQAGGAGGGGSTQDEPEPVSNRQVAAQAMQERSGELKNQKVATKRDEQQKTANAKKQKAQVKEDRRKRAVKGERKS